MSKTTSFNKPEGVNCTSTTVANDEISINPSIDVKFALDTTFSFGLHESGLV
jgi:hypothetical protein